MNPITTFALSLALATVALSVRAEAPVRPPETSSGVVEGVAADASPEMQAERDELVRQWEADARAAGIDPATAEADTGKDQSSR
jgi:hypothetical protein